MPNNIEERVVEMRFENDKFEQNAKESISTLGKLKQALNLDGAQKSLDGLSKASKSFSIDTMVGNIASGIDKINDRYNVLGMVIQNVKNDVADALTGIVRQAGNTVSALSPITQTIQEINGVASTISKTLTEIAPAANMAQGWEKYADKTRSVQTIMNATGKSITEVEDQLQELMWFSDETSYSFTDMTSNIGKFTSQGIDLGVATKSMMGIANAAALAGANSTEASRAMYNISQAMGAGYMKLIDWKSIENANMATAQFKQSLIDAGVAAGTLRDKGEGLYAVLEDGQEKATFTVASFNQELARGWLNTEVMLSAFQEYGDYAEVVYQKAAEDGLTCAEAMAVLGDEYEGIGKKAFKAAQEAKTFGDMVDATKDAVSSQWSKIFQEIFGNYEEARNIWTWWANEFYELFADPLWDTADLLGEWHENGGYTAGIEAVSYAWQGLKEIIGQVGDAWNEVFPKIESSTLVRWTEKLRDGAKSFYDYFHAVDSDEIKDTAKEYYKTLDEMSKSGQYTQEEIRAFADQAQAWVDSLQDVNAEQAKVEKRTGNIRDTVKGLASVLDIVKQALKSVYDVFVKPMLGQAKGLFDWILEKTGALGRRVQELAEQLRSENFFTEKLQKVRDWLDVVKDKIVEFANKAKKLESVQKLFQHFRDFKDWLGQIKDSALNRIKDFFTDVNENTGKFNIDGAVNLFDKAVQKLNAGIQTVRDNWPAIQTTFEKFAGKIMEAYDAVVKFIGGPKWASFTQFVGQFLGMGWDGFVAILKTIGSWFVSFISGLLGNGQLREWGRTAAEDLVGGVKDFMTGYDWGGFIRSVGITAFTVAIGKALTGVLSSVGEFAENVVKIGEKIPKFVKNVSSVFKGLSHSLNASAILKVAISLGIMAAALYKIAQIPDDQLDHALLIVTELGVLLTAIMAVMEKIKNSKASKATANAAKEVTTFMDTLKAFATGISKGIGTLFTLVGVSVMLMSLAGVLVAVGIGLALIVASVLVMQKVGNPSKIKESVNSIMPIFDMIMGLVLVVAAAGVIMRNNASALIGAASLMKSIGTAFLTIGASLFIVALAVSKMAEVEKRIGAEKLNDLVKTFETFIISISSLMAVLAIFGRNGASKNIRAVGSTFLTISAGLLIVAGALAVITNACDPASLSAASDALVSVSLALGVILGVLFVISKQSEVNFGRTAAKMAALASVLVVVSGVFLTLAGAAAVMASAGAGIDEVVSMMVLFAGALTSMIAALNLIQKGNFSVKTFTALIAMMTSMATAVLILSAAVSMMSAAGAGLGEVVTILLAFAGTLAGLVAAVYLVDKYDMQSSFIALATVLTSVATAMLIMAGAASIMAATGAGLSEAVSALLLFAGALAAVLIAAKAFEAGGISKSSLSTIAKVMVKVSVSMIALAAAAAIMASTGTGIKDVGKILLTFAGTLGVLVVAALAIEKLHLAEALSKISSMFIGIGVSVIAFAIGVKLLASSVEGIPKIMEALAQGIVTFGKTLIDNWQAVLMFSAVCIVLAVAASKIGTIIASIATALATVIQSFGPFIEALANNMGTVKVVLIGLAATIIIGLLEYLSGALPTVVDSIIKLLLIAIESIALALVNNADEIGGAIVLVVQAIGALVINAILGILEQLLGFIPGVGEKLRSAIDWIEQPVTSEIESSISNIGGELDKNVDNLKEGFGSKMEELGSAGSAGLNKGLASSVDDISTQDIINEKLGHIATASGPAATSTGEGIGDNIMSGLKSHLNVSEITGLIPSTDAGAENSMEQFGFNIGDAGYEGVTNGFDTSALIDMFSSTGSDGAAGLESYSTDFYDASATDLDSAIEAADDGGDVFIDTVDAMATTGADTVDRQQEYYNHGLNNMKGLIWGTEFYESKYYATIDRIASTALAKFAAIQEIQSPSKKTKEFGRYFDEGLVLGLKQKASAVYNTVGQIGTNALDTFADAVTKTKAIIEGDLDIDPTIRPVLDLSNIASGTQQMNSMMSGWNPRLSFAGIGSITNLGSLAAEINAANAGNDDVIKAIKDLRGDINVLGEEMGKMQIVMDSGALVGATSKRMDRSLGRIANLKSRNN